MLEEVAVVMGVCEWLRVLPNTGRTEHGGHQAPLWLPGVFASGRWGRAGG